MYKYILQGEAKTSIIDKIEEQIYSIIANYDEDLIPICEILFDTNDYVELKELKDFLDELIRELNEEDYIISFKHTIYYYDNAYNIERKGFYWVMNNIQYNTLVDLLEELATF